MVKHAIFHEGHVNKSADNGLIKQLIQHLELDIQKVHFYGMGSKSNFFKYNHNNYQDLKLLLETDQINKALFVIDADNHRSDSIYGGFNRTQIEIIKTIDQLNIKDCCDTYISCDPKTKEGYIESLILSSIPIAHKKCIETFFLCSNFSSRDNSKAILNQLYKRAYPNEPYNFEHSNFDSLKEKIIKLFA